MKLQSIYLLQTEQEYTQWRKVSDTGKTEQVYINE